MNDRPAKIDEAELQAWIDGRLNPGRAAAVAETVAADEALAARARAYKAQNAELAAAFGFVADEPIPERLQADRIARRLWRRRWQIPLAACVACLVAGLAVGWLANGWLGGRPLAEASRHVAEEALSAHRVYAVEVLHPVEVFADEEAHLVKWLSKRLGHDLELPNLTPLGFRLVGGRLLPARDGEPAAHLMYEDETGRRVSVYASIFRSGQETAFRYEQTAGAGAFVWLEPEMGYAIAGDIPREPLLEISRIVYEAFEPTH